MKVFNLFFIAFIVNTNLNLVAQSNPLDSLVAVANIEKTVLERVDKFNALAQDYKSKDFSISKALSKKAEVLSKTINYTDGEAIALRNQGIVATNESNFEEAITFYNHALSITNNNKIKGQIYGSLGRTFQLKSDYTTALDYTFKSLKIFEDIGDIQLQYVSIHNIANGYLIMGNSEKYYEYKSKAQVLDKLLKEQQKETPITATPFNKEQNNSHQLDSLNLPSVFFERIKKARNEKDNYELVEALLSESRLLINKKNLPKAIEMLEEVIDVADKSNDIIKIAEAKSLLGDVYLNKYDNENEEKNFNKAEQYYLESLSVFNENNLNLDELLTYNNISQLYHLKGDYKNAFEYKNKAYERYVDIFNENKKQTIKDLDNKYKLEKKDNLLKINQLKYEVSQTQKLFLLVLVTVLLLLGGLILHQNIKRKRANLELKKLNYELDQANKVKTRFFSILNHDLRSPVANLIHFLQIQKENPELLDDETKMRFEAKTMEGAENLLTSMEDLLLWSKGQMENFKPQIKNVKVEQLYEDTKKVFSGYQHIHFQYLNNQNLSLISDANYLKTIMRNLTSNAINAFSSTTAPTIQWKAWKEDSHVYISITDNGTGASTEKFNALYNEDEIIASHSGLGLHLVRDMAKAINCELIVDSKIGKGTTILLKLK